VARREELLRQLASELTAATGAACTVLPADLSTAEGCEGVVAAVAPERGRLYALVNNAGLGTHGWFHELPIDTQRLLIDVNISAVPDPSHQFLHLERLANRILGPTPPARRLISD
jgi:hypothetical protein